VFHPGTTRLIAGWNALDAGRTPPRARFDPLETADLLPQMFLLAREGDRLAFRIAGEALRDLFARPLRGSDIFALFSPPARPLARRTALQAVRDGRPMVLISSGRTDAGAQVPLEIVLAPMLGADGTADRLIGLVQPTASLTLLEGRPIHEVAVRMAATAGTAPARPQLRLAAVDGQRIA
jgi:hypothetical protein